MAHAIAPSELRDINERLLIAGLREQELAGELRRQLAFTSTITDSLGEGVCALDRYGRIKFANPAVSRMLGWSEAELMGRELHGLVHVDCMDDCLLLRLTRQPDTCWNDDDVFMCRDETLLPTAYTTAPIAGGDEPEGLVVAFRDVTERKRRLHQEQIARANAEAAMRMRSETLQMVVHDLRTPLTTVKGTAQLLSRNISIERAVDANQVIDALGRIDAAAVRMMAVLSELLDVAQIQEGLSLKLQHRPMDLVELVRKVSDDQQLATHRVVTIECTEQTLVGNWDGPRLERVLGNLLSNALKYSEVDLSVTVRLWSDDTAGDERWAVVEVRDEGVGIPAADLSHVFERFHRGSNVAGRFAGTGLGLSGSKVIIEEHDGAINVDSIEGGGTTVTVRLPLV